MSEEYDLIVIGGGSGGVRAANTAASYGAKVLLADYVSPSPQGNKWDIGGTCVNVGCIPKKLFHYISMQKDSLEDLKIAGFGIANNSNQKWETMVNCI